MNISEDYLILIDIFIDLVESQAGNKIATGNEWMNDAQTLSRKLFQHLSTIQSISAGTSIVKNEEPSFTFIDYSSAVVIARTALETYLVFFHIFGEGIPEISKFNHKLWKLSGLISRQNYPALIKKNEEKLQFEKNQIEEMKAEIKVHKEFNGYTTNQQKQLLKGNWKVNKTWLDLGVKAGFHHVHFRMTYNFLCGYSHASYISALQIGQAQTIEEQRELMLPMLQIGGIIMAHFIFAYTKLFSTSSAILEANPIAISTAKNWHLTKERMTEVYGH